MISNERQYRITKSEAERFRAAIATLGVAEPNADIHPRLRQAEREALESQLDDLLAELTEYERLRAGNVSVIEVESFEQLADGLVKARIATGLSQKALADKLGMKEQQIQRYEAERYASASYQRLQDVARALGVRIREEILLPSIPKTFSGLTTKLRQAGLDRDFILSRLLPSADAATADGSAPAEDETALNAKLGSVVSNIYGWTPDQIFGAQPLSSPRFAAAEARFKMPAGRSQQSTSLYAAYANYLAVAVLKGCRSLEIFPVLTDARALKNAIMEQYGELTLRSALHYAWDIGTPVIPLRDRGTFHGACWRYDGRNVIVLKQTSTHEARWLFDLIHEIRHTGENPDAPTLEVIEDDETSDARRNSENEIVASQFAGDVLLNGRAEALAAASVEAANGSVERLKSVVPGIANRARVSVGALANYLAFRLSWQGINWWGAASNLQKGGGDPWTITRDVFLERFPFDVESDLDLELLKRALQ